MKTPSAHSSAIRLRVRSACLGAAAAAIAATQWSSHASAQGSSVSYTATGTTYTQNFNSLPTFVAKGTDVNTANPVTLTNTQAATPASTSYAFNNAAYASNASTSGVGPGTFDFAANIDSTTTAPSASTTGGFGLANTMSGWYGGAVTALKAGAQSGSQTTGGIISFGTNGGTNDANRSLGLLATTSTGVTFFGVKLVNNTGAAINLVNFSFTGELWRQQTVQKSLNYGYYVDTNLGDTLPMLTSTTGATTTGIGTQVGALTFGTGTATPATAQTTGPTLTQAVSQSNLTLNTPWAAGSALWIVFQEASNTGGSQGIGIDDFSFSVPEPGTVLGGLLLVGAAGWTLRRRLRGGVFA